MRKIVPLERSLAGFEAWITGRKRYHGAERERLPTFEFSGGRIKVNPVAGWTNPTTRRGWSYRDLPQHPLLDERFGSIGCAPCTAKPRAGVAVPLRALGGPLQKGVRRTWDALMRLLSRERFPACFSGGRSAGRT